MLLETIALAIALGIAAQLVADRMRLPAILPLLLFGILAGPNLWKLLETGFQGLLEPEAMGHGLEVLIHLGIAIILFEGGLSLNPTQLRKVGSTVRNLLTIGVVVTGAGSALLAWKFLGLEPGTAALFGAIVTVTGPTVIVPLMRHMILPRKVKTVLISEGLIIDPIGAVLAYFVLLYLERPGMAPEAFLKELFWLVIIGSAFGFVAGSLGRWVVKNRIGGEELRNLVVLGLLMVGFLFSEQAAQQSGILMSVVMGLTMSYADLPDVAELKAFKGQLTVLLISILFILLSAALDLQSVLDLGWAGAAVVIGMILLVRPLSVLLSVFGSDFEVKDRLVLGLTAPRGIVAAGVASLSAQELRKSNLPGGDELEGLTYLTILATVIFSTIMALVLPRMLGYTKDPARRRVAMVGSNSITRALAVMLQKEGRRAVLIDGVSAKLKGLPVAIETKKGDARDAATFEGAGVQADTDVLSVTTNDELNLLVAELVREEFGVEHPVVALGSPPEELGTLRRAWVGMLGERPIDVSRWIRRLDNGKAKLITVTPTEKDAVRKIFEVAEERADRCVVLLGWQNGVPNFHVGEHESGGFDHLTLMVYGEEPLTELQPFLVAEPEPEDDVAEDPLETSSETNGAAHAGGADPIVE